MSESSLFKQPSDPVGITFMLRGEPGSGKTRFALGAKRTIGRMAYIGTDRGAKFYRNDPEVGGFLQVESRDIAIIRAAIIELEKSQAAGFGGVVIDTVTDLWEAEQALFVKQGPKGPFTPINAWKPMRDGHERLLRALQALPVHTFLICEEKPVYLRIGGDDGEAAELKEIGTKEDADKKDSYVSDVRLRFFVKDKRFLCEVLKDRTGTFKMGEVVQDPRPEMWIKAPCARPEEQDKKSEPAPEEARLEFELLASTMIAQLEKAKKLADIERWKKQHKGNVEILPDDLRERVFEAGKRIAAELNGGNHA